MALKVEGVMDRGMHAEEALGRSSRFEALHFALSSPHRLMRILGAIVRPPVGPMTSFDAEFSSRSSVRCEFVGRHPFGDAAIFLQKLAHEFQRSRLVSLGLNQDVEDFALGIDGAPEVDHAAGDLARRMIAGGKR